MSACVFTWSVLEFFFPLSSRNKYCFMETYDPIKLSVKNLKKIFDRLPKYQILIEILLTTI